MASPPRQRILALLVLSRFASCTNALQVWPSLEARRKLMPRKDPATPFCRCQRLPTPPRHRRVAFSAKSATSGGLWASVSAACSIWNFHTSPCFALELPPLDLAAASVGSSSSGAPLESSLLLEPLAIPVGLTLALVLTLGAFVQSNRDSSPSLSSSNKRSSSSSSSGSIESNASASSSSKDESREAITTTESVATYGEESTASRADVSPSAAFSSASSSGATSQRQELQDKADEVLRLGSEVYRLEALLARAQAAKEEAEAALADYRARSELLLSEVCAERDEAEAQATTALEATKDAEDDAKQSRLVAENALRKAEEAEARAEQKAQESEARAAEEAARWVRAARRDANKRRSTEGGGDGDGRRGAIVATTTFGEITESALEAAVASARADAIAEVEASFQTRLDEAAQRATEKAMATVNERVEVATAAAVAETMRNAGSPSIFGLANGGILFNGEEDDAAGAASVMTQPRSGVWGDGSLSAANALEQKASWVEPFLEELSDQDRDLRLGANTVAAIATDDVTATEEVATADVIITPAPSSSTSAQATKTASLQEIGAAQRLADEDEALRLGGRAGVKAMKVASLRSYLTARGLPIEDADDENESGSSGKSRRRYQKRELAEIVVDFLGL